MSEQPSEVEYDDTDDDQVEEAEPVEPGPSPYANPDIDTTGPQDEVSQ